ncbi:AfsR/SARP family transcriptional regulator [Actinospica sp.]|uniref:AfsR/SARP family transcriptional regulator n=1 Tax=Actinospica sp. TaxID=1872142 RepID=UPI002BED7BE8|nr:BTAD domain-containing putative transcriptional regulator [Actinospica sp.]HWG23836.1 BTAD domain-containing putative transcriptional regulator [Actinospica sp.]
MRYTLLGSLSVADAAGPVVLRGAQRRTLLAVLLLHAGEPVSAEALIDLLWGEGSGQGAVMALYNQIKRLRQVFGDENLIRAVPPGYSIRVEPGELDLHVFAEECAAGRRKLADRKWSDAARHYGTALGLWRGRPLADIPALTGIPRVRELEEARVQALQGRIEAELQLGRHHELIGELRELIVEHPRHEAFRSQLMLALYRSGQAEDAAAEYDAYQESLLDDLGLEPSAALRELRVAIVRRDPALSLPPNPNAPRQLPTSTRAFTGREAELAELIAAAGRASGAVVISALDGMGGIGKTALAVHAAHHVADRFPDGQLFIDLRGHAAHEADPVDPGQALAYLLRALGTPAQRIPDGVAERAELYRTTLADSRTLIVLDNAADGEQVRPLLPGTRGCLVLITSRGRLAGLTDAHSLTLDILGADEAVALLVRAAGRERTLDASPEVRELAALCGFVPLALRIVAARLRHSSALRVEDLLAELRDEDVRLGHLTDGERDLTSVFESSYAHLPKPEQRTLRLLGVLPGPEIDAYAAANLLDTDTETAARLLDSLLNRSLLIQQAEGRYGMHDLVRAYARTLMDAASDEAGAARNRLADYYRYATWTASRHHATAIRWREAVTSFGPSPELDSMARAMAWLRTERADLLAAVADAAVPPERRIDLALGLASLLQLDGPWAEAVALQEQAEREAAALGDTQSRADALRNLAQIITLLAQPGAYERSKILLGRALGLYREVGNRPGEADALFRTGRVLTHMHELDAALVPEREALDVFREIGDRHGEALALQSIADTVRMLGRNAEAVEACRATLAIHRELGNRQAEATALQKLGYVLLDLGEHDEAHEALVRAVEINREFDQRVGEGASLDGLGMIHTVCGEYEQAGEALNRAYRLFDQLDYPLGRAVITEHLGRLRVAAGDPLAGIKLLEESRQHYASVESRYGDVEVDRELGWARIRAGDPGGSELILRALDAHRGTLDDPPGEVDALVYLGLAALEAGDAQAALARFDQALPLARRIRRTVAEARSLDGVARCRVLLGDPTAALEPLREAVRLYRSMRLAELGEAEQRLAALGG